MAKSAPYPPCTVTVSRLKYQDSARMLRRVTLTEPYRRAVIGNLFQKNISNQAIKISTHEKYDLY